MARSGKKGERGKMARWDKGDWQDGKTGQGGWQDGKIGQGGYGKTW